MNLTRSTNEGQRPSLNEHFTIVEIDNIKGELGHHEAKDNEVMPNSIEPAHTILMLKWQNNVIFISI